MNILNIDLKGEFLKWNQAWVLYRNQKYPMFQLKIAGYNDIEHQGYLLINDLNQEVVCIIQLGSQNLGEVLDFIEANRQARKNFT